MTDAPRLIIALAAVILILLRAIRHKATARAWFAAGAAIAVTIAWSIRHFRA